MAIAIAEAAQGGWLATLPADVQAALLGNGVLVLGGFLTVALTAMVAIMQLRAEREERAKDRALQWRKEVLMRGVEGAYAMQATIAAFANFARSEDELADMLSESTNKLVAATAVASVETVRRGRQYVLAVAPLVFDLLQRRAPVDRLLARQAELQRLLAKADADLDALAALHRRAGAEGDARAQEALADGIHAESARIAGLRQERDDVHALVEAARRELIPYCMERQLDVDEALRRMVASVRVDAEVDSDDGAAFLAATTPAVGEREAMLGVIRRTMAEWGRT